MEDHYKYKSQDYTITFITILSYSVYYKHFSVYSIQLHVIGADFILSLQALSNICCDVFNCFSKQYRIYVCVFVLVEYSSSYYEAEAAAVEFSINSSSGSDEWEEKSPPH